MDAAKASSHIYQAHQDRPFECSCGRTYKSYPALYTHIKNKHDGKVQIQSMQPPGLIKKPAPASKKRGRPANHPNTTSTLHPKDTEIVSTLLSSSSFNHPSKQPTDSECILKIASLLAQLPTQTLNRNRLNEITSIVEMNVYLITRKGKEGLYIGNIISQFFQELSSHITWEKFEQTYTLIMLLVQFVSDELSNTNLVKDGPIDLLCDFINDFLQIGIPGLIESYQLGELSILREENMLELFQWFFQWLMVKRYTNYKIGLNCGFKKVETTAQF